MNAENSITISRKDFIAALDRARREGKKEAAKAKTEKQDAARCPSCMTWATLDHIAEKSGRCPFCCRFYPPGTKTHAGKALA